MFKIQTLNKISPKGLDLLPRAGYEVASEMLNPDAYLVRSASMLEMDFGAGVKAIARAGAGVNNIPVDKCTQKGIVVFNTPGANANGVKELALLGMLLASRNVLGAIAWEQDLIGKGDEVPKLVEKGKSQFAGRELAGKKLGIIGLGSIGVMVANAAVALGMDVTGFDPYISVEAAWGLSHNVKRAIGLDSLIASSDFITVHVPYSDKTKGLINRDKFQLMKKGAVIINLARGGLVNNADLRDALVSGAVECYVTDFPDEELLKTKKVIAFPHLGASTEEAEDNCAVMAANQIRNFLDLGTIKNSVNFPDCEMGPIAAGGSRILVANRNVPNMVGQMTSILAEKRINISEMLNKHKGEIAFNIINVDGKIGDDVIAALNEIEGVIMTRVILAA